MTKQSTLRRWVKSLFRSWFDPVRPIVRRARTLRLEVERLESRVTPSNFVVTSSAASGAGSLAAELALANADNASAENITFAPANFPSATTITLTTTLALTNTNQTITIDGTGAGPITISGGAASRDVTVNAGVTATFTSLTIINGFLTGGDGAGISSAGTLTLNNSTVSGCSIVTESATAVAAGYGAGIYSTGSLTLNNSTVSGCSIFATVLNNFAANGFGGGIANTGGLTLNNSVVSGCSVITIGMDAEGGGIYNSSTGSLALNSSAILYNTVENNVIPAMATNPGLATSAIPYVVGDILTVLGGTGTAATLKVTSVSAVTGQATGISINSGGNYTVFPSDPVSTADTTTVGATGATFHLTFSASAVTSATVVGPYNPTFVITNPGAGYYTPPAVDVSFNGSFYSPGGGATATGQVSGGIVTGITLTSPGSDYVSFSVSISIPGFAGGGGIYSDGSATALNSTISGNTASSVSTATEGGGILSGFSVTTASLTLTNSVLSANSAADGGGVLSNATLVVNAGSASGAVLTTVAAAGIPAAASGSSTSFAVANAWVLYQTWIANPNCFIQIDSEQMLVTGVNVATNTVTVTRGYNGTGAPAHLAGANVASANFYDDDAGYGGGIFGSDITTVNSGTIISYNNATYGGGIYSNETMIVNTSAIVDNDATQGGGIYGDTGSTTTVNNGTIYNNSAVEGGGILSTGTTTVNSTALSFNTASDGGGIYTDGTLTVNSGTITYNSATDGGGIFSYKTTVVYDGTISFNTVSNDGGGIWNDGTITVYNALITQDSVTNGGPDGGGVWNQSTAYFYNSTISDNSVAGAGGGFGNDGNTLIIGGSLTTLSAPVADTLTTSITVTSAAVFQAQTLPVLIQIDNEEMQVTAVAGNILTVTRGFGGTLAATHLVNAKVDAPCLITGNSAVQGGGGIYSELGTVTVTDSSITTNSVSNSNNWGGGGVWMESQTGSLIMLNSSLTYNTANNSCTGGLLNFGAATITDCTISNNSASANVGGIDNVYGTMTIIDSTIDNNTATGNGGGIENGNGTVLFNIDDPNATLTVEGGTISGNSTGGSGGGIFDASGTMTVENSALGSATISGNSAAVSGGGIYQTVWSEYTDVFGTASPWNNSGNTAPGSSTPASVVIPLPSTLARTMTISANGGLTVSAAPTTYANVDPDGTADPLAANIGPFQGLSGIIDPNQGAILGVFLNGAENGSQTAPATLNFATTAFSTLSPVIDQVFFVGDGKTGDGSGAVQQFVVPTGATALVLGVAEGSAAGPSYPYYNVGDILQVVGGVLASGTAATLKVTSVNTVTGQVNGIAVNTGGNYTSFPTNPVATIDTTTPSALGATFSLGHSATAVTSANLSNDGNYPGFFSTIEYSTTQGATVMGATISHNTASINGGGIDNDVLATLTSQFTLQGSTIAANSAVSGGGIYAANSLSVLSSTMIQSNTASAAGGGIYAAGTATVDDSTIGGVLSTLGNSAPSGGGIYAPASTLTIQNGASIQQNTATTGGGIDLAGGTATVTGSTIAGNSASGTGTGGGGVENDGVLSVTDSTLSGNSTSGAGGGVRNNGTATFIADTLSTNTATGNGAGAISSPGAGSFVTVVNSTVSGNSSSVTAGGITSVNATLVDSTLTGNTGATAGGVSNGGTLSLANCTITGNSGTGSAPGGLLNSAGNATLLNTIVAGNTATTDPDIDTSGGTVTANGSLIGNTMGSSIAGGAGNILNPSSTGIGTLGGNGGPNAPLTPPQTIPLVNGSPAIDSAGAVTTLAAAVTTTGVTTISVTSASVFAQSALPALASGSYFTIQVDGEQMQVTAMTAAGVMTVTRGANGTPATTHLALAPVYLVSDERGDVPTYAATPQVNMGDMGISNISYSGLAILPPSNVEAGQSFTITVDAINLIGTAVGGYNGPVTLALGNNPSGATLGGTLTVTAVNGIATVPGLTVNKIGIGYTLLASAAGLTGATSSAFNVTASQLTITTEPPASVVAGSVFALTVKATDAFGDVDTNYTGNVTLTLASNPGGATLGGTVTATCVAGVANFANLTLNNIGSGYTIRAASTGLTSANSTAIQVTASQLTFTVEPPANTIVYNTPFSVTVAATDGNGNVDPTFSGSITLTLASNPGGSTLSGTTTVTAVNGAATFPNLALNNVGIGYTLQATGGSLPSVISSAFQIFGNHFVFTFSPPATVVAGATFPANVTAQLEDHNNNPVATSGVPVSLALAGATLLGTTTGSTDATGLVTFTNLSIDTAGTFVISASSAGVGNASASIVVTAGPIKSIAFVTQPSSTTAGTTLNPVTVQALDQYGNGVPGAVIGISIAPGSLSTGTTPLTTNAAGLVVYNDLSEDTVGTYSLTATTAGLASVASHSFTITAAAPATLTFLSQPNSTTAGTIFNPITVLAEDQFNNVSIGTPISIALSTGVLSAGTTLLTTNASGLVVYTNLAEDVAGTYTLSATAAGPISASSMSFVISPLVSSATLTYLSQPTSTTAGITINAITVQAADKFGNPLTSLPISIGLPPATLTAGTTPLTTGATGQVVFGNLLENTAGTYSLKASATGLVSIISNPFTISAAATTMLTFRNQPSSTTAGTILNPITVAATDQFGNPTSNTAINIALAAGALSTGTTPLTTGASGQVVFGDLSEDTVGTYTLVASSTGLTSILSNPFVITPLASSAALVYLSQPSSTTAGSTLSAVTVQAEDKFGNGLAGLVIGIAISPGTLNAGTTPLTANSAGQVVFGDLVENKTGNYTLTASASGLANASSNPFTISVAPGWTLTYVTQPNTVAVGATLNAITLLAVDQFGNVVPGPVSIALSSGTLGGTTTAYANSIGQVVYSNLTVPVTGLYTLTATLQSTSAVSNPFAVTSSADKLTFVVQPTSTTAGASLGQVTLQLTDPAGDLLPGVAISVTLSSGTLTGTAKGTTGVSGQVIFGSLSVAKTGTYTLTALAAGIPSAGSNAFTISTGTVATLSYITQPGNTIAGNTMNPVTVKAVDLYGNVATGLSLSISTTPGKISGTLVATTNAAGLAVFSSLVETISGTCVLTAAFSGLSITSNTFVVSPASPFSIAFLSQPNSTTAGTTLNPISVKVSDKFGNAASNVSVSLLTSINTINGTTVVATNAAGDAVFTNLYVTKAATGYTLSASASGLTTKATSSAFTITPAAGQMSFVTQPIGTTAGTSLSPITIRIVDKYGNAVTNLSVTARLSTGTLGGTTTSATNTAGQVIFTNLSIAQPGVNYTLTFLAANATSITSNPFTITAALPPHLTFSIPPTTAVHDTVMKPVTVQLYNANGTPLDLANVAVTMKISSGSLLGAVTVFTNASGQAVFSTLEIASAGVYTLTATAVVNGASLGVTSGSFTAT